MKTDLFLLVSFLAIVFFPACDGESNTDFPTDIIQNSGISDSIFQILLDDAKLLCLNLYMNEESRELNDIEINKSHIGPVISALQMVYSDTLLQATRNIRKYQIHALCQTQLHKGMLIADSSNTQINSWFHDGFSGHSLLDDLIYQYEIKLDSIGNNRYTYRTESGINYIALASELKKIPFILDAKPSSCIGDGSQIEIITYNSDFIHLIYSYGWEDCPSGCIHRHYWELGVYGSGFIETITESGKDLP